MIDFDKANKKSKKKKNEEQSVIPEVLIHLMPGATSPEKKTLGAAAYDIKANNVMPIILQPGETKTIPTGLKMIVPEGFCVKLLVRSGLSHNRNISLCNGTGLIDSDYRDEVGAILTNHGKRPFEIKRGDRIVQMLIEKIDLSCLALVDAETFKSICEQEENDRKGGFGSTGI